MDNGDGTYTIVLDVQGTTVEDDESHYANVLIVLDATTSMRQNNKWTYAKQAINALIEALCEGDNEGNAGNIDFSLVTFGPTAQIRTGSWGTTWTKDNETFKSWCASNSLAINTQSGTNWEAGLWVAYDALTQRPDNDPTYVIFLTDGDPYGSGRTSYNTSGTSNYHAEQAYDEAQSITGYANTKLYGIYTAASGAGDSYNRLVRVISNNGGVKTIYAQPESIESEFQAIAETIINELGSNNVSVDDGIPSLSSVSADVVGEAGGFEYQISTDGGETYSDWAEAPGASFSDDNGVTWDLSKLGTVQPGSTYRLKFTVWPSQEAYDLIADLNNSIVTMTEAELEAAGIAENDGVYTLKTNTHLKTNYTFNGEEYTDEPDELAQKAMLLPTETISVQKIWNNLLDQQDPPSGVKLILTKDGADYLAGENAIEVSSATSWKAENIYISNGQIKTTEDGYEILETGHDYEIVEPDEEAEGGYRWELKSDIYHPMVIDGTDTMLIQDDDATGTDGVDFYTIVSPTGSHKYVKAAGGANELHAWNDRRSWLQVEKKVTGDGAPADALFEFTATINEANGEDVWYSAFGPDGIVKVLETNGTAETDESGNNNGYYYVASGSPITVKIKDGWTLRFLNLPSGTIYTIDETNMRDCFAFDKAEGRVVVDTQAEQDDPQAPSVNGSTVTGTINVPNVEFYVDYTNKYVKGDLKVTKTVVSDLAADADKEFSFTVTLSDTSISGTYGDMTFANGVATVTLKGGESKTATGLPANVDYTVEETAVDGFTTTPAEPATGTIMGNDTATAEFTNTRQTGGLTVTKTVVSDLAADKDQEFTFKVTLSDTSISKTYGDMTFTNGVATVTLKGGESAKATGLPTTVGYTITEADAEGFQLTGKTGDEGTITTTASAAKFTNTRETGDLEVTKTVKSNRAADRTKDFSFTVTLDDKTINGTYGDMTFKDGVATFTLKGGKSATATGLPTTLGFTVTEADEKDITTTKTGDTGAISTTKSTAAFVNKHTDSEKEVISGKAETYVDGELVQAGDTLTYTITYANNTDGIATVTVEDIIPANTTYVEGSADPAASFDGSKLTWTIEGVEPGATGTVTFQVTVDDAAAGTTLENTGLVSDGENESSTNTVTTSVPVKDAKDESGASVDGGSVKVGDTITFEVNFKLTEDATSVVVTDKVPANTTLVEGSISNGGTVSDGTITWDLGALAAGDYTVSFKVTIDESAVTVDAITNTASINVNNHSEVNTNTTTTKTEKGGLTISKTVTVPEGFEIDGNKAFTFKITLTDKNGVALTGEYAYTGSREGTLKSGDSFELKHGESITIAGLPAGAKFSIAETADAGYVADQTTITGEIPANATASATAAFVNAYTPNAVSAQLQATKALNGRNQVAGEFSFELKDSNGTVVKTATNAADGTVDFGQLSFTEPGTYTYTATEVKGDDVHVTYDSNTITYTVTVIDNGDGTLSASVTSTGNATFTNTYKGAEPVWIDPPVQKVIKAPTGTKPAAATFTFQMKAITEGAPMPEGSVDGVKTMEITGAGTKEFGKTTYTEVGTYVYEITEVKGNAEGYTYDTAVYTLTVEVTEGADGNLVAKETYVDANGKVVKSATATFTNTYTPKPPVLPQTSDDSVPTSTLVAVAGTGFALLLAGLSLRLRRNEE